MCIRRARLERPCPIAVYHSTITAYSCDWKDGASVDRVSGRGSDHGQWVAMRARDKGCFHVSNRESRPPRSHESPSDVGGGVVRWWGGGVVGCLGSRWGELGAPLGWCAVMTSSGRWATSTSVGIGRWYK